MFVTDLRPQPERGLSKVYLKSFPSLVYYIYGSQTDRLISAAFSDGLVAVVVPVGRWGYIDESGLWAFAPVFRQANRFDHGLTTAQLGPKAGDQSPALLGTWVLLDKAGSMKGAGSIYRERPSLLRKSARVLDRQQTQRIYRPHPSNQNSSDPSLDPTVLSR